MTGQQNSKLNARSVLNILSFLFRVMILSYPIKGLMLLGGFSTGTLFAHL